MRYKVLIVLLLLFAAMSCTEDKEVNGPSVPGEASISGTIPVLYIDTENGAPVVSKTEYLNAAYWLDPMGADDVEALGTEFAPLPMQIRGRGHSSWKGAKKGSSRNHGAWI